MIPRCCRQSHGLHTKPKGRHSCHSERDAVIAPCGLAGVLRQVTRPQEHVGTDGGAKRHPTILQCLNRPLLLPIKPHGTRQGGIRVVLNTSKYWLRLLDQHVDYKGIEILQNGFAPGGGVPFPSSSRLQGLLANRPLFPKYFRG